jgi:flagellar assembly protein FliH
LSASDDIVLRGPAAARAQRIDLVVDLAATGAPGLALRPTGPWADDIDSTFTQARQNGFTVGRQEGLEVGLAQGLAEAREQTAQLTRLVEQLISTTGSRFDQVTAQLADEVLVTALAIAEAVVGRAVACATDPGAEAIARCLAAAPLTGAVVAHLNPDDLEALGAIDGLEGRELSLVPDPQLTRGDAVVLVDQTVIDGRLATALDRVAEVLLGPSGSRGQTPLCGDGPQAGAGAGTGTGAGAGSPA